MESVIIGFILAIAFFIWLKFIPNILAKKVLLVLAGILCIISWVVFLANYGSSSKLNLIQNTKGTYHQFGKVLIANDTLAYIFSDYDKLLCVSLPDMAVISTINAKALTNS